MNREMIDLAKHEEIVASLKSESRYLVQVDANGVITPVFQDQENIRLKAENENLKSIIAKELSENDEFGAEFVHVNILKEKLRIAVDALKEVRDYDMGRPYAYCVGFLQEEARGVLKKIEGEN